MPTFAGVTMPSKRALTLVVIVLWILSVPLAGAFGACAAMGMMCEGPCGASPRPVDPPSPALGWSNEGPAPTSGDRVASSVPTVLEPPPKLLPTA